MGAMRLMLACLLLVATSTSGAAGLADELGDFRIAERRAITIPWNVERVQTAAQNG